MDKNIKIAISGKSGCGNTTVSRLVAESLGLRFINFTFRNLAQEHNKSIEDILLLAKEDDSWDRAVDGRQVTLAREAGGCVLGSRLAIWLLKEADLKVYLKATSETRAKRIMKREGGTLDAVSTFTEERDRQDHERFLRLYNIDTDNCAFADLIIDTDALSPTKIAELIIHRARQRV